MNSGDSADLRDYEYSRDDHSSRLDELENNLSEKTDSSMFWCWVIILIALMVYFRH